MLTLLSVGNYPDLCKNVLAVAQAKGRMAVLISECSCVYEQFFCNRIGMGKIEAEGVLSLKEYNLTMRKRAWKGICSL